MSILENPSVKNCCYQHVSCWLRLLWWMNISSFTLVRFFGPFGPMLASAWTSDIFATLSPTESRSFQQYLYSIFRQHESGENVLTQLLNPGAYAMLPLNNR